MIPGYVFFSGVILLAGWVEWLKLFNLAFFSWEGFASFWDFHFSFVFHTCQRFASTLRRLTVLGDCNDLGDCDDIKEEVALGNHVFPLGRFDCRFGNVLRGQMFWFVL